MSGIFDPGFEKWSGLPSPASVDVPSFTGEILLPSVVVGDASPIVRPEE